MLSVYFRVAAIIRLLLKQLTIGVRLSFIFVLVVKKEIHILCNLMSIISGSFQYRKENANYVIH
jgi:hypothetical protein